jgi:hexokinase
MVDAIAVEMQAGLVSEGGSKLKMLLTFVDDLPNGSETGTYYALHLGGSYFRIIKVHLGGQRSSLEVQDVERHSIPTSLMNSTSEVLFDFLASSLQRFIEKEGNDFSLSQPLKRELAFTFSFPVKQTSISSGVLIKWTKGFAISEMAGEDIAECLQGALNKRGLDIRVAALVSPLLLQKNHILGELLFHCNSFDDFPSRHKILMP